MKALDYILFFYIIVIINFSLSLQELPKDIPKISLDQNLESLSIDELEKMLKSYDNKLISMGKDPNAPKPPEKKVSLYDNKGSLSKLNPPQFRIKSFVTHLAKPKHFLRLQPIPMNIIAQGMSNQSNEQNSFPLSVESASSQSFLDTFSQPGRKGQLVIGETDHTVFKNVWVIVNSRVLAIYSEKNYLKLLNIYRLSQIGIEDYLMSPCFFVFNKKDKSNRIILCAINSKEKELWVNLIKFHKNKT